MLPRLGFMRRMRFHYLPSLEPNIKHIILSNTIQMYKLISHVSLLIKPSKTKNPIILKALLNAHLDLTGINQFMMS